VEGVVVKFGVYYEMSGRNEGNEKHFNNNSYNQAEISVRHLK
jgi:hypothetical protein